MAVNVTISPSLVNLTVGVVEMLGVCVAPAHAQLQAYSEQVAKEVAVLGQADEREQQCQEIRQLLRHGKFKASGRSKPAQEYLLRCVTSEGKLPSINGPVDLLNAVSLYCNLPISLLSIQKCSDQLWIDRGQAGQEFVFNSVGHTIDLTDLITTYDRSTEPPRPVGTPIKDSMAGKIDSSDTDLVAIIYSPSNQRAVQRCHQATALLADGMRLYCSAQHTAVHLYSGVGI